MFTVMTELASRQTSTLPQVSDKYAVSGDALWAEIRARLRDALVFVVVLTHDEAPTFLDQHADVGKGRTHSHVHQILFPLKWSPKSCQ